MQWYAALQQVQACQDHHSKCMVKHIWSNIFGKTAALLYLVQGFAKHLPQEFEVGQGIGHQPLCLGVGVQPVVRGCLEETGIRVKPFLHKALHKLLEQAPTINACLF